jgi:hypothetical protein
VATWLQLRQSFPAYIHSELLEYLPALKVQEKTPCGYAADIRGQGLQ